MQPDSMRRASALRTWDVVPALARCRFNNCLCTLFRLWPGENQDSRRRGG